MITCFFRSRYVFNAESMELGRWLFQPPGAWHGQSFFVWYSPDGCRDGVFSNTQKAYELNLLDRTKTEQLFFSGELHRDFEASIVLEEFNFAVNLSVDVQGMIIALNASGIYCAQDAGLTSDDNLARDALSMNEILHKEIHPQVNNQDARLYPKPYLSEPLSAKPKPRES